MKNYNRKRAEEFLLKVVKDADPSLTTFKMVKEQIAKMDDKRFHEYMLAIKEEREYIPILMPNNTKHGITIEGALDLCDKYGIEIFQRFWYRHPVTKVKVLSNFKVPFVHMPVRRQIETLFNKISTADDSGTTDTLTGQGVRDASATTQPESLVAIEKGLEDTLVEKLKYRGGDVEGGRLFDKELIETGRVSTTQLYEQNQTTTRSVQTADIYLVSAGYETNLDPTKR